MKSAILCILFVGAVIATPTIKVSDKTTEMVKFIANNYEGMEEKGKISLINEFVDMIMTEVQSILGEYMDPMAIPDQHELISFKPIIITYWGELNLTSGQAAGASTLTRDGNVTLDYTNRVLTIDVPIKFQNFKFDYDYSVRIMGLGPTGGVEGSTSNVRIHFVLGFDFKTYRIELKEFDILKLGRIDIKFTGNVLIDWLINLLTDTVTFVFKFIINWIIEIIVKNTLLSMVDQINEMLAGIVTSAAVAAPVAVADILT